ncbi:MAG: TatD family hydrolase [Colwellia sp.]
MQFTDSHCHLDDKVFSEQLPQLLEQCQQLTINRIIIPSISPDNFSEVLALTQQYHHKPIKLYACLGIHPWFLKGLNTDHLELLQQKVAQEHNNIIAIGEIGLDGAIAKKAGTYGQTTDENWQHQQYFFDFQLNLAKQQNLPVIVHHRQSHDKIIPLLKKHQLDKAGIIHGFSGSYQQAKGYIDLGFKLGVGSTITYSRAKKTINTIKRLPLTSLVLETDAPSMPLSQEILTNNKMNNIRNIEPLLIPENPLLGLQVNSPRNIIKVFSALTTIRTESAAEIAFQLEDNIEQVFFS